MNWIIILIVSAAAVCVGCVLVFRMDLSEFGFLIIGGVLFFYRQLGPLSDNVDSCSAGNRQV